VGAPAPAAQFSKLKTTWRLGNQRAYIVSALMSNNWNKAKAAEELHWSRMTLYRKLTRLKIMPPRAPALV
jgi:transcriptional regulator of acetoin/glycerol metabolism